MDNPIQRLMVKESSARIDNVMTCMVLALLSVPVIANLASLFVALLFEKRKKTRWALRHTDFLRGSRITNPTIQVPSEHKLPRFRVPQVKHRDEIILKKTCRSKPLTIFKSRSKPLIIFRFGRLRICVKIPGPCGEPLNAKRPNALLDLALPQNPDLMIAFLDWIALKKDASHFASQNFDLGLQDLSLQDFDLDPQSGPSSHMGKPGPPPHPPSQQREALQEWLHMLLLIEMENAQDRFWHLHEWPREFELDRFLRRSRRRRPRRWSR